MHPRVLHACTDVAAAAAPYTHARAVGLRGEHEVVPVAIRQVPRAAGKEGPPPFRRAACRCVTGVPHAVPAPAWRGMNSMASPLTRTVPMDPWASWCMSNHHGMVPPTGPIPRQVSAALRGCVHRSHTCAHAGVCMHGPGVHLKRGVVRALSPTTPSLSAYT